MIIFKKLFKVRSLNNVKIPEHLKDLIKVGTVMMLEEHDNHDPMDEAPFKCTVSEGFFDKYEVYFDICGISELVSLSLFDDIVKMINLEGVFKPAMN